MKNYMPFLLSMVTLPWLANQAGAVVTIYSQSFSSFSAGDLTGQGGWVNYGGAAGGTLTVDPANGNPGGSAFAAGGATATQHGNSLNLQLNPANYSELIYTLQVQPGSFASLDVASNAGGTGAGIENIDMELASDNWFSQGGYRIESTANLGIGPLGDFPLPPAPTATDWYELKIDMHNASNTIDFTYTDLTTSTIALQSLGNPFNASVGANMAWVRMYGWGTSRFDNLSVTGVGPAFVKGDINGDGLVNLTDYGILKGNFLNTVTTGVGAGDMNSDGVVNIADFALFKQDYIAFNGGGGSGLSVPEPASLVLLAAALPGWYLLKRRTKKGAD